MCFKNKFNIYHLYALSALFSFFWFSITPALVIYLVKNLDASYFYTGFIAGIGYISYVSSTYYLGKKVDDLGAGVVMKVAFMLLLVSIIILLIFGTEKLIFLFSSILFGFARSAYRSANNVLIKHISINVTSSFVSSYTIYNAFSCFGALVGTFFVGFLDIRLLFLFNLIIIIVSLVFIKIPSFSKKEVFVSKQKLSLILSQPWVINLLLVQTIFSISYSQIFSSLPMILSHSSSKNLTYGLIVALNSTLVIIFSPFLKRMLSRLSFLHVSYFGFMAIFVATLCLVLSYSIYSLLTFIVFFTFGEIALFPIFSLLISENVNINDQGKYYGVMNLSFIGSFAGSFVGGIFLTYRLDSILWITIMLLIPVSMYLMTRIFKQINNLSRIGSQNDVLCSL
ncbi:MFS transporter [Cysteiniphilum sp. QT6929]|uniref:MFS transporter n=1 Tax=Cysteiniphilum sp. QT6929 TaxID=2975055 RepID=UPI0024B35062|nr:MFS transporter [Cysteiniphilum sp. QT6929]WHN65919.1 MFS transporter [Cysteiniphilum sp. QT6929]